MCGNRRFRRMLPLPELDFLHARDVGCVMEGVHPPAEDERQFLVLHGNRQIERNFRLPAVAQQLLPRLMTQRAIQHVLHPPGDKADIRAVQGKFDKFPNRDAKFLHGALLSDKKRQTAASPSAALTAYFALFPHSSIAHAGISLLRERVGGNENRRSLRSPPTPLRSPLPE